MKALTLLLLLVLVTPVLAQQRPSPQEHLKALKAAGEAWSKQGAGEDFCWHVAYSLGDFAAAYQAWKDPAWLEAGVAACDYAISKMTAGPDGFKGWVGPYGYAEKISADVHVGDAILINDMLALAELVLADESLKKTYGGAVNRYVEVAKREFVEKWVSRGTWREDGPYGAFVQWDMFCPIGDPKTWTKESKPTDANFVGMTLPFNKQNDAGMVLMKLYRITGEKVYRERAQKIFAFMKSRMVLVDDYYVWNYWEPFGPWDVDVAKQDTHHWMGVHPYRNYQAGEIGQIVEAYHTGIVFDRSDIERILNTNLKVMWNQDKTNPKFANSNARLPENPLTAEQKKAREEQIAKSVYAKEGRAGCLWGALAPFSQTIRDLEAGQKGDNAIRRAYFENVTLTTPVGFERLYGKLPVTVFERAWSSCPSLTVAAVMPQTVTMGKPSVVLCKAYRDTDLEVAVYSADGKEKKQVLFSGKVSGGTDGHAGIHVLRWSGMPHDPSVWGPLLGGDYRIRWTTPDGYREFPVSVVARPSL